MSGKPVPDYERTLEKTSTWSVAVVCFVLLAISISIEHVIHLLGKWLTNKRRPALYEALEVVKNELMLLGFISLLLTVFQDPISGICVSKNVASTWLPCGEDKMSDKSISKGRRLLDFSDIGTVSRRSLATKGYDKCTEEGKVAFVTAYGIHQLHIFIFVLAIFHVLYCITTLALGTFKMRKWKVWENETKTPEYQFDNDPERFRFARETSFGRRHLSFWSRSPISLWIVCFFRQFFGSVTKVDYKALRHGFIMAHLAPENGTRFDFQEYIRRSLEEDFKVVVGISPTIWFAAVLLLLSNTHGWYSYLWLPFISLIIILMVGTKLEVIITKMGLRIKERGDVVMGTPLVQPGDELFWFGRPRFLLFLIHFVLFQNAFQLAFFAWSTWQFKMRNCFHQKLEDIIIRIAMGIIIQILCSYVTLPLYALVTQMGSTMKPTIFHDRVATALKHWHHGARKHVKHGQHSNTPTPSASAPATPEHGSSPIHLLHHYQQRSLDGAHTSPRKSNAENQQWAVLGLQSPQNQEVDDVPWSRHLDTTGQEGLTQKPNSTSNQHEIDITLSDFSFQKQS
ncbi:MLO-like protein 2 [Syzygium oleosum]|uniref:MLO-like protein 2 n=1 Tax=Syzygium oleosum TaxID=219896 RepID=UPI0011D2277F|nr:MLO-like protein 2 [Syzygium oleosum]